MAMALSLSWLTTPQSWRWRIAAPSARELGRCRILGVEQGRWSSFFRPSTTASRVMASMSPTSTVSKDLESNDSSNSSRLPPLPEKRVLVGCGTITLDFLATVESYPKPDDKIRSTDSLVQGGGNVGNALTAAARLGLSPRMFSKVGNDSSGNGLIRELELDGVDVSHIVIAEGITPFTYVIVDKRMKTRTCIHTPGYPPLEPAEYSPSAISSLLNGADLLYLDGRIPDAALAAAKEATKRGLPIIVDAERKREGLDALLSLADYVVASAKFPQAWTGAPSFGEALLTMALKLPRLKFVVVTQGPSGCVMLERSSSGSDESLDVNQTLSSLRAEVEESQSSKPAVFSSKVGNLHISNFDDGTSKDRCVGRLLVGTADYVTPAEVVDTTGAGDAFIGGVMYALCAGLPPEKMLMLGATVAAAKCRALGARTGLPSRSDARVSPMLV